MLLKKFPGNHMFFSGCFSTETNITVTRVGDTTSHIAF